MAQTTPVKTINFGKLMSDISKELGGKQLFAKRMNDISCFYVTKDIDCEKVIEVLARNDFQVHENYLVQLEIDDR